MKPILTKPLIQYGVEEALEAGCREIGIVTGRGKRAIEDHFDINYELEHQISGTDKEKLFCFAIFFFKGICVPSRAH